MFEFDINFIQITSEKAVKKAAKKSTPKKKSSSGESWYTGLTDSFAKVETKKAKKEEKDEDSDSDSDSDDEVEDAGDDVAGGEGAGSTEDWSFSSLFN